MTNFGCSWEICKWGDCGGKCCLIMLLLNGYTKDKVIPKCTNKKEAISKFENADPQ